MKTNLNLQDVPHRLIISQIGETGLSGGKTLNEPNTVYVITELATSADAVVSYKNIEEQTSVSRLYKGDSQHLLHHYIVGTDIVLPSQVTAYAGAIVRI